MPGLGVNIAITQDGQILLTQREDFEVWCLPGGEVDAGETIAQAAVREALEETGLEVQLTRLVGLYSRPRNDNFAGHIALFAANPVGGTLRPQLGEVIGLDYFSPEELPDELIPWHRQRIRDAFAGLGGSVVWAQSSHWGLDPALTRQEVYDLRDRSGLSRADFFRRFMGANEPSAGIQEVGP